MVLVRFQPYLLLPVVNGCESEGDFYPLVRDQEVSGSNPLAPTNRPRSSLLQMHSRRPVFAGNKRTELLLTTAIVDEELSSDEEGSASAGGLPPTQPPRSALTRQLRLVRAAQRDYSRSSRFQDDSRRMES